MVEFSVQGDTGMTATQVLEQMRADIDDHELFSAMLNEENQLVVTAEEMEINYTAVAEYELVGVEENALDMVA